MEVNSISKGYRRFNEDLVTVVKDHLFMVIDSATGLTEPFNSPSDGVYLASNVKEYILNLYKSGKLEARTFEKKMNVLSRRLFKRFIKGMNQIPERYQFPSASISLCFINVCDVHIFSIGDTSTYVRDKSGKGKYISDKSIPLMDKDVVNSGLNINNGLDVLRKNRTRLNRNGRKPSFSLYKNPHLKFKHYKFDIRKLDEVYLCSDGYYQAFNVFHLYKTRKALFSHEIDLQDVYKSVMTQSMIDKDMKKYPRVKQIDDISAIRVTF